MIGPVDPELTVDEPELDTMLPLLNTVLLTELELELELDCNLCRLAM